MYPIIAVLLAIGGCITSKRIFGSLLAPLSLYGMAWSGLILVHFLLSEEPNRLFFSLSSETLDVIFLAWSAWIAGSLLAQLPLASRKLTFLSDRAPSWDHLRRALSVIIPVGMWVVIINFVFLFGLGILGNVGDDWRLASLNISSRSVFGRAAFLANILQVLGWGAIYSGTILAIYGVVRYRRSPIWVALPVMIGVIGELLTLGRYWITYSAALVLLTWLFFRGNPSSIAGFSANQAEVTQTAAIVHSVSPRVLLSQSKSTTQRSNRFVGLFLPVIAVGIAFGAIALIAGVRTNLTVQARSELILGPLTITGPIVGPVLYLGSSLALFDSYVYSGLPWEPLNGQIAVGGLLYLVNFLTVPFGVGVVRAVEAYVSASNAHVVVGPARDSMWLATYLLPAMSDFPGVGVVLYPFVSAFLSSRLFLHAQRRQQLWSLFLYPLVALLIVVTVARWEMISPTPWMAAAILIIASRWLNRQEE